MVVILRVKNLLHEFYIAFKNRHTPGFDVTRDLGRIGVVNQTTMLASDTQAIADYLKQLIKDHYQLDELTVGERFADTRDTLCYATLDNQSAVTGMLEQTADLAIVVGGRNSSNTSHLVELCEEKLPTHFIRSAEDLISATDLCDFNWRTKEEKMVQHYLPSKHTCPYPHHQRRLLPRCNGRRCNKTFTGILS